MRPLIEASVRFASLSPFHFFFSMAFGTVYLLVLWSALFVVQSWLIDNTYRYIIPQPGFFYAFGYRFAEFFWLAFLVVLSLAWLGAMRVQRRVQGDV